MKHRDVFKEHSRLKLLTERNHYKWIAQGAAEELAVHKEKTRMMIIFLVVIINVLLGVLIYVVYY